jgi:acetylornithine deacetylase/succinyl-diaminopimelate desuccinylase-like protein
MQKEATELISEMIRNRCVNPPGGEIRSIRTISRYLESHGVEHEIFESAQERGNLLAEIPGTGERPSLMFGPSHVDVVPVEDPNLWKVPPFEGITTEGCIWGRGAIDMLFITACQAVVFAHLCEEGFRPRGTLKLLVVADEEAGGHFGAEWMVKNHTEKVKVDYLVTEAGGFPITPGRIAFMFGEKGASWIRLQFKGEEQHGSMPYGTKNAITNMSDAIQRLNTYHPPINTKHIRTFLGELGINPALKFLLTQKRLLPLIIRLMAKRNIAMARLFHSLSSMTMSPNLCNGGTKVNVIPGQAHLDVDIRTLPGQDEEYVYKHLRKALGSKAEEAAIIPIKEGAVTSYGNASDPGSPLVQVMREVVQDLVKVEKLRMVPMMMPGATDCRFFREAFGTQAYGFSLFDDSLDVQTLMKMGHGDNERVPLATVELTAKAHLELAKRFLS